MTGPAAHDAAEAPATSSRRARRAAALLPLIGATMLIASSWPLQAWSLRARPVHQLPAVHYLRSPEAARRVALSFDAIVADLYWVRALQHFGSTRLQTGGDKSFRDLYPYLDLATSLDQRFNVAYRFGAIFLSEAPPGGPGRTDLAITLLEKGLAHNPDRWQYWQDIGFVHYWWTGDFAAAANAFSRGAAVPGAPWWMKSLAAMTLATGGDRQTSRLLWQALAQTPDNEWLRRDAQRRLVQLDALDQIDRLEQVVARARAGGMQAPWTWAGLFARGWLQALPLDPAGTPYVIDLTTGRVTVHRQSALWPLPVEPLHLPDAPGVR